MEKVIGKSIQILCPTLRCLFFLPLQRQLWHSTVATRGQTLYLAPCLRCALCYGSRRHISLQASVRVAQVLLREEFEPLKCMEHGRVLCVSSTVAGTDVMLTGGFLSLLSVASDFPHFLLPAVRGEVTHFTCYYMHTQSEGSVGGKTIQNIDKCVKYLLSSVS